VHRHALVAALALVHACRHAPPVAPPPALPPPPTQPPPAPLPEASPDASLDEYAVDDERPWRAVLYTWASPARVAEAARDGVLLRTAADEGARSPFSELLARMERRGGEEGAVGRALLRDPALRRYRYAWASAFATSLGFEGRSYGSALVRIELRPDALVLRLAPGDARPVRIFDRDHREAPASRFEALRHRIGAVYHARRAPEVPVSFREYVVVNASMVTSWEAGTPAVCDELARERRMVEGLAPLDPARYAGAWARAMATAAPHYRPTADNLRAVAASIERCDVTVVRPPR